MTRSRAGWCNSPLGWAGRKPAWPMANKNARILWAVMTRDQSYDPHHVSVKPLAKQSAPSSVAPAEPAQESCTA